MGATRRLEPDRRPVIYFSGLDHRVGHAWAFSPRKNALSLKRLADWKKTPWHGLPILCV